MNPDSAREERERVRRVYDAYSTDPYCQSIWQKSPASRHMLERKWALIARVLRGSEVNLDAARVVDLGCGGGADTARLREMGVRPERLVALDLLESRVRLARQHQPWMASIVGDASELPLAGGGFDLVYQSRMLSSVLDRRYRQQILGEVDRILAPGGMFLSYDTRYPNPWNRQTRPVRAAELRQAFKHWTVQTWSATLIPHLQRALLPVSAFLCRALEAVPPLRSHLLVLAIKPR